MRIICLLPPIAVNSSTVPIKAIFPSRKTATLSHNSSTSAISWLARIIVLPCDFNARICSCNDTRPSTSRPAVGSSRKIMSGLPIRASARCKRRFCPVDKSAYFFLIIRVFRKHLTFLYRVRFYANSQTV